MTVVNSRKETILLAKAKREKLKKKMEDWKTGKSLFLCFFEPGHWNKSKKNQSNCKEGRRLPSTLPSSSPHLKIPVGLLVFIFPDLVWCWSQIIKQIFRAFVCLISKLFTLDNVIFKSALHCWILITSEE